MPFKQLSQNRKALRNPKHTQPAFMKYIGYVPFLACLSSDELKELAKAVIERRFVKDEIVLLEEDTCKYFYIIYSGKLKAVKVDLDGREHIVAIHRKGEFFGEVGIVDGKTSPATVVAMENAHVGLITKFSFETILLSNQKVLRELLQVFCARLRDSWLRIRVLAVKGAERRIRAVLGLIALQSGGINPEGVAILPKLAHKDIAHFASLSRETVTRQLRRLSLTNEILILKDRQILLNRDFFKNSEIL
jgi:CRP/FNR family cyclic AMP-dependent transcriptional regulator